MEKNEMTLKMFWWTTLITSVFCTSLIAQVTGTGTKGKIAVWTGSSSIGNALISQKNGDVAIGTNNPQAKLHVQVSPNTGTAVAGYTGGGVQGTNFAAGVFGENDGTSGTGVYGLALATTGQATAIYSETESTAGNAALFNNNGVDGSGNPCDGMAACNVIVGQANASTVFRVGGDGHVHATSYDVGGADFAESMVAVGGRSQYQPGDLMAIDRTGERSLTLTSDPYSTNVAGIYSTKPGVLASPYPVDDPRVSTEVPLAVVGIVPCKVTAENGLIQAGDLLVTSSTPGHAMRGTDRNRMLGAIVGKALESLSGDKGVIQVLVMMQ
jgi:hypothetical protein